MKGKTSFVTIVLVMIVMTPSEPVKSHTAAICQKKEDRSSAGRCCGYIISICQIKKKINLWIHHEQETQRERPVKRRRVVVDTPQARTALWIHHKQSVRKEEDQPSAGVSCTPQASALRETSQAPECRWWIYTLKEKDRSSAGVSLVDLHILLGART